MSLCSEPIQQDRNALLVSIYVLRDPRTGEVRYVGKAVDPPRRLRQHMEVGQLDRYRTVKNSWLKNLAAAGERAVMEVLEVVEAADADAAEIRWIAHYLDLGARLTNGTRGGDGGAVTDPEARARISAAHLGAKHSDETRQKMSASAKARCADPAERERLRLISNGKPPVNHGEKNPRTKLSDAQVRQLRERAAAGEALKALAAEYGITAASVTQVVTGQTRVAAGGPIREAKPRSVLSKDDVAEIRRLAADGIGQTELARRYGVHPSHICKTLAGQRHCLSNE